MESISQTLQPNLEMLKWDFSKRCEEHESYFLFDYNDNINSRCPVCYCEGLTKNVEQQEAERALDAERLKKYNTLQKLSIIQDETLRGVKFNNYKTILNTEEHKNKGLAIDIFNRYRNGEIFNLWIQGNTGVGKSHLGMSILEELNESDAKHRSCLFIDIARMLELILDSFVNKESRYTQAYFIGLLGKVDFLVLDDLGAETGDIDSKKKASEYTSKVLRSVVNSRQDKATIITTNLPSVKLKQMYDGKVISRMMRGVEAIVFKESIDKRPSEVGF